MRFITCYDLLRRVHGVFSTLNTCDPTAISGSLQHLEHAMGTQLNVTGPKPKRTNLKNQGNKSN